MGQFIGKAEIFVDGEKLPSVETAKLKTGGVKREKVEGPFGLAGFKEMFEGSEVTVPLQLQKGQEHWAFKVKEMTNVTIHIELDTGAKWIVTNAFCEDAPDVDFDGGKVEVTFAGNAAEQA